MWLGSGSVYRQQVKLMCGCVGKWQRAWAGGLVAGVVGYPDALSGEPSQLRALQELPEQAQGGGDGWASPPSLVDLTTCLDFATVALPDN
jgi:hypothetical protein